MENEVLRSLPQIEKVLQSPVIQRWFPVLSRPLVSRIASSVMDELKASLLQGNNPTNGLGVYSPGAYAFGEVLHAIDSKCREFSRKRIIKVINATGIILHTNLGRTPIAASAWNTAVTVNTGYSNLEFDLSTGKRGQRNGIIPELFSLLLGSEASLVVNNNAAAVFLMLSACAEGKEVIVSRGEQIQIGGGFRLPEILALSRARLVEVGTTNITTLKDYIQAITSQTAMVLIVHTSNFKIRGFTQTPSIDEIANALPGHIILAVDQGSGTTTENIPGEKAVKYYLKHGAHLVSFSADKILGGPQAGVIAGREALVKSLSSHPLMRVFRPGKTIYSILEECLVEKLNDSNLSPVERIISLPLQELKKRGRNVLRGISAAKARLVPSTLSTGGGSAPDETFPSFSIEICIDDKAERVLQLLRENSPPIIGTISDGRVRLNLATIEPEELSRVKAALKEILGE
ncbi:MAG: L-seryl-tRNA(Sec) selenium transferase [Spirochaetota bacterium]